MACLEIRTSTIINVIILIVGLLVSGFLLLFGVANLINPDVPDAYLKQNTKVCLLVCIIGVVFLLLAIAAFRGILLKKKRVTGEHEA
jgi:uncharacterized membrane protein YbhN (UPF0104 family)